MPFKKYGTVGQFGSGLLEPNGCGLIVEIISAPGGVAIRVAWGIALIRAWGVARFAFGVAPRIYPIGIRLYYEENVAISRHIGIARDCDCVGG